MWELQGSEGFTPAGRSQWLALADALDSALVTVKMGIPDLLWFGPTRRNFDLSAEHVISALNTARWEVLSAEMAQP